MNKARAIKLARAWVEQRKEVRKHLILAARAKHPWKGPEGNSSEERKLWHYPSDLSEERLLKLIDEYEVDASVLRDPEFVRQHFPPSERIVRTAADDELLQ